MAKVSPSQQSFNAGELTPLLGGRPEIAKYSSGLEVCLNYVPLVQGPITRRPGTMFVAEVKDSSKATRLVRFEFSTTQAYVIEFGDLYFRFFKDNGFIEDSGNPGVPYELVSPYAEADLFQLKFTQSADVLYVTHPNYAPRKLSRTADDAWTVTVIDFLDGPYLPTNVTSTTLAPSAVTGAGITITASALTGINGGLGFQAGDVGRLIRIKKVTATTQWGYAKITAVNSTTVVVADVLNDFGDTVASTEWRLGAWSTITGFPGAATFYSDRLFFGGSTSYNQRLDGSRTGDYENFAPSDPDGLIVDDHAVTITLNANTVNAIRWLLDDEKGLVVGTTGGEWLVRPTKQSGVLSPTNIEANRSTTRGSADIQALRSGKAIIFVQKSGRAVRELAYVFEDDGFDAPDMTRLAEHITLGGIKEIGYQAEPQSVVWGVRNDGVLIGLTYERADQVVAWHRHILGGVFGTGNAVVESVAVIPSADGTRDEVWLIVKRTIDGATKRYVEYITKFFAGGDLIEDAFFVDSGLTYSGAPATVISGLDHLEGETVQILADGAVQPDKTVSGGSITLSIAASKAHIGRHPNADGRMLRLEAGAQDGTAQGKTKRIHRCTFRFYNSVGLKVGPSFTKLAPIIFRTSGQLTGAAVPLFNGDKSITWDSDYDTEGYISWRQDQPLPSTITAIMPQLVTQDRG